MLEQRQPPNQLDLKVWLRERSFKSCLDHFDRDGFVIIEKVLDADQLLAITGALAPHLDRKLYGRNDFEGLKSHRVYALLAKSPVFAELAIHPLALAFAERDLGRSCLLSACLAIKLLPGETVQPWHYDDSHIQISRPRPSAGVSAFWAIDATTSDNGATEVLPGSHLWPEETLRGAVNPDSFADRQSRNVDDDPGARPDIVKAVMPAGSLMIAKGALWHRGGANRSSHSRLIITPQYCAGWARQLENMIAAIPAETAASLPRRAQELIGYSIHPPFMGYVDGMHPGRILKS